MAKKGKKGGKKGGKKAEPQEQDMMTEVEKELFQIQITDLQQKVERMRTRCLELEVSNEEYQKRYEQLDEDRADIIAYLKKMLQEKEDEITELKERLEGLLKTLEQDKQMYEEKIAHLEHEFKVMHEQLTSEIKLLTGKLNSLEEFRLQRDDLMKKFKVQEQNMEEQEERHKRTIYEIERKFIIGKDKLKKEMEAKLLQLSLDFQDATHIRIAATTHRTIRENIAINNELERMLENSRKLTAENEIMRERDRTLHQEVKLREDERDMVLEKNMVQLKVIKKLSAEYEEMTKHIGELQYAGRRCKELEEELRENRALLNRAVQQIGFLEQNVQAAQYENSELYAKQLRSERDIYLLQKVLKEAVRSIQEALAVQKESKPDTALAISCRETLLVNLLQLLNTADLPEFEEKEKRLKAVAVTSAIYEVGDLGLVPRTESEGKIPVVSEIYTIGSQLISKESFQVSQQGSKLEAITSAVSVLTEESAGSSTLARSGSSSTKSPSKKSSESSDEILSKTKSRSATKISEELIDEKIPGEEMEEDLAGEDLEETEQEQDTGGQHSPDQAEEQALDEAQEQPPQKPVQDEQQVTQGGELEQAIEEGATEEPQQRSADQQGTTSETPEQEVKDETEE